MTLLDDHQSEIIELRRYLHEHPEVSFHEKNTATFIKDYYSNLDCKVRDCGDCYGIIVDINPDKPGKKLAWRADFDGLAIQEDNDLPFKSQNPGVMHACGHDMHTTMLLGAAKLLKQYQQDIQGTVKLVFQSDEEGFTGAKAMLKAGVLDNPHVDAGMALHVNSGTPSGMVLCGLGTCMAGCTLFQIKVKGTGCHGAMPETGVDPINIAAHIYLSLQEIVSREISPTQPVALTIGKFVGGKAPNIIPEEVVLEGTIRTLDRDLAKTIFERIETISKQTAALFRGQAEVVEIASAPPLLNNVEMVKEVSEYVKEICSPEKVIVFDKGGMGSEDFASYTYDIPCSYLLLGAGTSQENDLYGKPMHNECVVFNEDILPIGSAIFVQSALNWLKNHV